MVVVVIVVVVVVTGEMLSHFIHVAAYESGVCHKRAALFAVLIDKSSDRNLTGMNRCRVNVEVN